MAATMNISSSRLEKIELNRSEPPPSLTPHAQRLLNTVIVVVGCWQLATAALATLAAFAVWPVVAGLPTVGSARIHWWGPDLSLDVTSGALLLGLVGGVAGSLVHTITIFSSRVGRDTLEASYLWWYLLRPFAAALLALLFVASVVSGLSALNGAPKSPDAGVAFVAGGLAGLFTDAVLQKLRNLLGATSTEQTASSQQLPLAAPPVDKAAEAGVP